MSSATLKRTMVSSAGEKWPFSIRLMVLRSTPAISARRAWLKSESVRNSNNRSARILRLSFTSRFKVASVALRTIVFAIGETIVNLRTEVRILRKFSVKTKVIHTYRVTSCE